MFNKLKSLCTDKCVVTPTYETDPDTGKATKIKSYRFFTKALLKDYHKTWYTPIQLQDKTEYKKILPKNIDEMFTPLFVTIWFACDGTKSTDYRGARFEVTALSPDEREILKKVFLEKYQIYLGCGNSRITFIPGYDLSH